VTTFNFQVPANGASVAVADFKKAVDEVLEALHLVPEDAAKAKQAAAAAAALVQAGHAGDANVYATIGVADGITSVGVHARPAPAKPAPVVATIPGPARKSPYDTGPSQEEIEREAAATGKPVTQVAQELGAASVTVVEHKGGVTTSTTKAVEPPSATPIKGVEKRGMAPKAGQKKPAGRAKKKAAKRTAGPTTVAAGADPYAGPTATASGSATQTA